MMLFQHLNFLNNKIKWNPFLLWEYDKVPGWILFTPGRWYSTRMDIIYSGKMIKYQDGSYLLHVEDTVTPPSSLLKEESTVYAQFIIYLPARLTARFIILELTLTCTDHFLYIVLEILKKWKLTFNELKRLNSNCKSSLFQVTLHVQTAIPDSQR